MDPARRTGAKATLVLDTGALIALERGDARAWSLVSIGGRGATRVVAPILVVMEALFGSREPGKLRRVLSILENELPLSVATGHQIAHVRRQADAGSDADASVVLEALARPGSIILTGDTADISSLLAAAGAAGRVPLVRL